MTMFADYFRNQAIENEMKISLQNAEKAFRGGSQIYHVRSYQKDVIRATREKFIELGYIVSSVDATNEVNPEYSFTVQY